jgi:hypothetical protein
MKGINMKLNCYLFIALMTSSAVFAADQTHSGQASANAVQSGSHASASAGHSIAASGQVTSAASAIPLAIGGLVSGTAGAVSSQAARDSARAATAPIGKPLEITDETITVMPPDEALKKPAQPKSDKAI